MKGEYALSCGLVDALFENDQDFSTHVLDFATRVSHEGDPKRSCEDMTVKHPDPRVSEGIPRPDSASPKTLWPLSVAWNPSRLRVNLPMVEGWHKRRRQVSPNCSTHLIAARAVTCSLQSVNAQRFRALPVRISHVTLHRSP